MKSSNPQESLLDEALTANWPIPGFSPPEASQAVDRIDSPLLLKALLDGGFTSKGISPANAIVPQLKKLSNALDLNAKLTNRLLLVDIIYDQLKIQSHLDPSAMVLLYKLRPSIIRAVLTNDDLFIKSSKHPLRKALNELCSLAIGWDSSLGKNGERYLSQLGKLTGTISTITIDTKMPTDAYQAELKALQELSSKYEQIELRLCQSEQGMMESKKNRRIADDAINDTTENKTLPTLVIQFLHSPWRDALHRILALHGHNSKDWLSALQTMEKLIFCVSPDHDEQQKQQQYKHIASMRTSLEKYLHNTGNDAEKSHWLDEIENLLQHILMGEKPALEAVPKLTNIAVAGVAASVSSAISQQVAQFNPGQWVLYKTESGEVVRGKLALIDPEAKELLFVNLLGAKRFTKSHEEFGYALTSKKVQPLNTRNLFDALLTRSVELFIKRHQEHKTSQDLTTITDAAKELKQKSAEKALAEANNLQALEKEKKNTARPPEKIRSPVLDIPTIPLAQEDVPRVEADVNSLEIGSWLSMKNRLGQLMPCRIAVVYASTGRMVVVDKCGMRVGEFRRPELIQLIMQGEAKILEKSDSFESSLARVIQTLRKD